MGADWAGNFFTRRIKKMKSLFINVYVIKSISSWMQTSNASPLAVLSK